MKKLSFLFAFIFIASTLNSCIGEDVINDEIDERVVISDRPDQNTLTANATHQLNFRFFNNVGDEIEGVDTILWSSSNENVATVSNSGLVTAIDEGTSIITAAVREDNATIAESSIEFTVLAANDTPTEETPTGETPAEETETPPAPQLRSGTGSLTGANNYRAIGDFTITEIANSNNLELSFASNYSLISGLPGPYLYLSNNPNSIRNALEISKVSIFRGANSYTIENVNIDDYAYVLFWCRPFNAAIGRGSITIN